MTKRKFIAHVRAREGDPAGKGMTLEEFLEHQRAEVDWMLDQIEQQLEAHFELEDGAKVH